MASKQHCGLTNFTNTLVGTWVKNLTSAYRNYMGEKIELSLYILSIFIEIYYKKFKKYRHNMNVGRNTKIQNSGPFPGCVFKNSSVFKVEIKYTTTATNDR